MEEEISYLEITKVAYTKEEIFSLSFRFIIRIPFFLGTKKLLTASFSDILREVPDHAAILLEVVSELSNALTQVTVSLSSARILHTINDVVPSTVLQGKLVSQSVT